MSTNNYILNLLNIKDENIHIITESKEKIVNFFFYIFRYKPIAFPKMKTLFKIIGCILEFSGCNRK